MHANAGWIAIYVSMFTYLGVSFFLLLFVSGQREQAAEAKTRARRLTDAKMNARLLRFNL
jgi:hypothetical protein